MCMHQIDIVLISTFLQKIAFPNMSFSTLIISLSHVGNIYTILVDVRYVLQTNQTFEFVRGMAW